MISREDYIFTIGYQGNSPVVDKRAKRDYGRLSTRELAEHGLYKPAFCSALYSNNEDEMKEFLAVYNEKAGGAYASPNELKRLFGVFAVPEEPGKVILI